MLLCLWRGGLSFGCNRFCCKVLHGLKDTGKRSVIRSVNTTASRMSYLCSTNKKYCVSLWEFCVVGPQSGRDDVRPRGDEQPADCVRRRPSMCFVGDTLFTAVLLPMLGGYLLVDDTLASWADMLLLRRY